MSLPISIVTNQKYFAESFQKMYEAFPSLIMFCNRDCNSILQELFIEHGEPIYSGRLDGDTINWFDVSIEMGITTSSSNLTNLKRKKMISKGDLNFSSIFFEILLPEQFHKCPCQALWFPDQRKPVFFLR